MKTTRARALVGGRVPYSLSLTAAVLCCGASCDSPFQLNRGVLALGTEDAGAESPQLSEPMVAVSAGNEDAGSVSAQDATLDERVEQVDDEVPLTPSVGAGGGPQDAEATVDAGVNPVLQPDSGGAFSATPVCDDALSTLPCSNTCGRLVEPGPIFADDVRNSCQSCFGTGEGDADGDGVTDGCDQCGVGSAVALEPIFYFAMDDPNGADNAENLGSANPLAQVVGPVQAGRLGVGDTQRGAFYFPGAQVDGTSRLAVENVEGWPANSISATFWVRTQQTTDASILSYAVENGSTNEFSVIFETDGLRLAIEGVVFDVFGIPLATINNGAWHFFAITWQGTEARFFLDGLPLLTIPAQLGDGDLPPVFEPGPSLNMRDGGTLIVGQDQDAVNGSFGSSQSFIGGLDEVAIYANALSEVEILRLFGSTTCGEVCSGRDDDLDGLVDEGLQGSGPSCPALSCDSIRAQQLDFGRGNYFLRGGPDEPILETFCSFL